ncbi:hypothetical protein MNBD_GAMMA11-1667 [hydrothermal vent metagenome]|uniref:Yip1 domain-containing protein n=1 Tax=hydrothermal vent metagenome TaxID=652676 RepID=A0A3B0XUH6_9ZZZZ
MIYNNYNVNNACNSVLKSTLGSQYYTITLYIFCIDTYTCFKTVCYLVAKYFVGHTMLAKHFTHIFYEPKQSLRNADRVPAKITDIMLHIAFLSLIPTICAYVATVYIGWDLGVGTTFTMAQNQAAIAALAGYIALNVGVYVLGYSICWLAKTFNVEPNPLHCTELAVFASLPLFALGFVALYPVLYINVIIGFFAIAAAVYLLYIGIPIFMHIPEDEGFVYSTWVITIGLVMLVVFMGGSVFFLSALSV